MLGHFLPGAVFCPFFLAAELLARVVWWNGRTLPNGV
jgi:hypothetical protein